MSCFACSIRNMQQVRCFCSSGHVFDLHSNLFSRIPIVKMHLRQVETCLACMAGGITSSSAAAGAAAMAAAAVPGPAAAGRQLQCSHAGSHAGPQGRSAHLSPVQGRLRLLLPSCTADHSLRAHPAGLSSMFVLPLQHLGVCLTNTTSATGW